MKYWDRLRSVEDEIIRLDSVESILRVLGNAEAKREDMLNIIWYLEGAVEDINQKLSEKFYDLFNEIREDSRLEDVEKDLLITRGYVNPSKISSELNDIVNGWVRSEGC
jgi:hypothetical protein